MQKLVRIGLTTAIISGIFVATPTLAVDTGEESEMAPKTAELLSYTRLYTGADDETHFEDVGVNFVYQDYSKTMPPVWFPEEGIMDAAGFHFVSMPPGWDGADWHPAPRRQFIIPLSGEMEFQVSDGEKRVFGPGDVLLVEDTSGKGHISQMVSSGLGMFAVVPLPD